jgi:serine/threonine-protein kinase
MCPDCKTALPSDAPAGLCPRCLLHGMLSRAPDLIAAHETVDMRSKPEGDVPPGDDADGNGHKPHQFDHYLLIEKIARGGLGVVFKARDLQTERVVALKMILAGQLASPAEVQRFRNEIEAAANLEHPNIVPIYDVGEFEQRPYYTMKLMAGSLAGSIDQHSDPRAAARLTATICWAIHFAHQRGVLHRDLKPHNILLDAAGNPHVSDFSLAKWVGGQREVGLTETGAVFGTPSYMAPEQASGQNKTITTAADVYAIGAILYELLTGRPPFQGENAMQTLRQVVEAEPPRLSSMGRRIDRDLETICLKCLEKEPSRRYGSAEELGKELQRYLKGQPIKARYIGRAQRVWRWCLRFPLWAGSIAAAAVFLVIMTLAALSAARAQQQERVQDWLNNNRLAAEYFAGTVLSQLAHFADAVAKGADRAELRRELTRLARLNPQRRRAPAELGALRDIIRQMEDDANKAGRKPDDGGDEKKPFDSFFAHDAMGTGLVRSPPSPKEPWTGQSFVGRDYFRAARRRGSEAGGRAPMPHVSRVFISHSNDRVKFAISMPVLSDDPAAPGVVGVLAATLTAGATFGPVPLSDDRHKVVLLGPRDTNVLDHDAEQGARQYVVLFDRKQQENQTSMNVVPSRALHEFAQRLRCVPPELRLGKAESAMDDNYQDPTEAGRWLAGFAQVGNTELIAVVQTPYERAVASDRALAKSLVFWLAIALAIDAAVLLVAAGYAHRKGILRWRAEAA